MILSVFLLAAATATGVSAHGYVPLLKIGNTYIPGWDISKGIRIQILLAPLTSAFQTPTQRHRSGLFSFFILQINDTDQPLRVVRGTKLVSTSLVHLSIDINLFIIQDSGYIADVTSNDITCSIGNSALPPVSRNAPSFLARRIRPFHRVLYPPISRQVRF